MWRKARIAFSDAVKALTCSVIPVHPWIYGQGQQTDSGAYLSRRTPSRIWPENWPDRQKARM